jgi:hypothetical protein
MNSLASVMQWFHAALASPGVWWVRGNTWCALKWQKLKDRAMEDDGSSHP